jgi:hypothetical protein
LRSGRIFVLNRNIILCAFMTSAIWFALVWIGEPLIGAFVAGAGFLSGIYIKTQESKAERVWAKRWAEVSKVGHVFIIPLDVEDEIEESLTDEKIEEIVAEWSGGANSNE